MTMSGFNEVSTHEGHLRQNGILTWLPKELNRKAKQLKSKNIHHINIWASAQ